MTLPPKVPGRAIMQYEQTLGYWEDDQMAILKAKGPYETFLYDGTQFIFQSAFGPLVNKANAHSQVAWDLYENKKYLK